MTEEKMPVAERDTMRERLDRFRHASTEASYSASATSGPGRSLKPRPEDDPGIRRRSVWSFVAGSAAITVSFLAVILLFSPAFGQHAKWIPLVVCTVLILAAAIVGWQRSAAAMRVRAITASVCAVVLIVFALGATNSVVLNGKVYYANSPTARSYQLAQSLKGDLEIIAASDTLLTYSPTDARAHYNEYAPAETQLSAIASKWAAYPLTGLPDPGFIDAINHTKTAANFAADGMATKQKLLTVDDAALITQLQNDRSTMATEALAASRALTAIAAKYNFSLASGVHE